MGYPVGVATGGFGSITAFTLVLFVLLVIILRTMVF